MALIHETPLPNDDKDILRNQVRMMFVSYKRGTLTPEQFKRHEQEWVRLAERVRKGQQVIDNAQGLQKKTQEHIEGLECLYAFLLKFLGFYEVFFKKMIGSDREYQLLQEKVLEVLRS